MSIIIASLAPKLDANPWLLLPTAVLLLGSMVAIVFAILAARPRVSSTPISLSDLRNSQGNILFFGNFANMSADDFVRGMEETMEEMSLVYDTMIRNIYGIGSVLIVMSSRVVSIHRSRLAQIEAEASATAGALQRIALAAQEVLARGAQLQIQPQMAYATGSILRMVKDWGVIESLQADGRSATARVQKIDRRAHEESDHRN